MSEGVKSPKVIDRLREKKAAIKEGICLNCGKPANEFSSKVSYVIYLELADCEECQEKMFL